MSRTWRAHNNSYSSHLVHLLQLVDHAFDDREALGPEAGIGRIETKRRQQLRVMLRAAGLEHVEVLLDETWMRFLIEPIERVHEAIAERVGIDVEWRMDEVRDVRPENFIAGLQLDGRPEALALHGHPQLGEIIRGQLTLATRLVHLALE